MFKKGEVKYGDILWSQFDPSVGHEFQDKRPAIVIQTNEQLFKSNLLTLVPLTANVKNKVDDDILVEPDDKNNLRGVSVIKVYDIVSHDYERITGKIGVADENVMMKIKQYLRKHFGF
jgi:mRNA-degrading endonuclease toxin of MazEF toxin-antitoxin module